jgi:hypothetical protein
MKHRPSSSGSSITRPGDLLKLCGIRQFGRLPIRINQQWRPIGLHYLFSGSRRLIALHLSGVGVIARMKACESLVSGRRQARSRLE